MTVLDYVVLLIMGASVLVSVMRGLVREALALAGWIGAFWLANAYTVKAAPLLPAAIPSETLRLLAAFVILFLSALLLMSLITVALSELVKSAGLGAIDRGLGVFFGLARGLLILLILVLLAGLTSLPRQDVWRNAMFSAPLEAFAVGVKPWLPQELAKKISYE